MKRKNVTVIAVFITLLAAHSSLGQGGMGRWGGRMYDPKTVETVHGQVISVEQIQGKGWGQGRGGRGGGYGVHLVLKTSGEEISVHVGPGWFLEKEGLTFAQGDEIEVIGSHIAFQGKSAIIAAEIKKGGQVLKLRDDNGDPVWRGRGRR